MPSSRLAERLFKASIYTVGKDEAVSMNEEFARRCSVDLGKYDVEGAFGTKVRVGSYFLSLFAFVSWLAPKPRGVAGCASSPV